LYFFAWKSKNSENMAGVFLYLPSLTFPRTEHAMFYVTPCLVSSISILFLACFTAAAKCRRLLPLHPPPPQTTNLHLGTRSKRRCRQLSLMHAHMPTWRRSGEGGGRLRSSLVRTQHVSLRNRVLVDQIEKRPHHSKALAAEILNPGSISRRSAHDFFVFVAPPLSRLGSNRSPIAKAP
jgi:hypothetical protein